MGASPDDLVVWETLVYRTEHAVHQRDKSRAALIANAVWGK